VCGLRQGGCRQDLAAADRLHGFPFCGGRRGDGYGRLPGTQAHKGEHKALVEQVLEFQKDFEAGKPGVAVALMQFLQKWLCHHIMETDKKYGPFLNEKGFH
jgi:hemerythrin HHE cation binding domain-containing protein